MLQKWKLIINNWINCYFDEQDVRHVNTDSLLTIISHLRENLIKYESKSSALEALTVEEFILKKYPGFKFKNGTVNADNEDDIYLVASLLLFFVCVNSKDMDLKSAMCSKLSADDQEIIMKFSKSLMECSLIGCEDVQTAIIEACGTDIANIDTGHRRVAVAETPPALRSLHGEVRRLQAALDAERFDRNFLQEELSRTNLRLEKLTKDKEQYKLDIRDLKAKISLCSRGDYDAMQMENSEKQSIKLERQLEDMEERLIKTQEQLEEAVYEKDSLMMKLEGLKQDRDKWFTLSQQESARAVQLSEELETERRQVQSLKELVNELRQHNRLNRLDSSLLECDDPDASIQSLGHNLSVCSEACVNVIEVQLSEERAKVEALKQQIQTLQKENEQLQFAIEEDNSNHEIMLKEKDSIIDTLEQQLKTQNTLLESLQKDHEDVTLSWEKHKLKSREIIEVKDERIQKLNEHLGSLKQEFSDLENVNQELTAKIEIMLKETAHSEKMYNDKILEENLAKELLLKDKERLLSENNSLKQDVLDQKAVQEVLLNDKQLLILEKQGLIDALDVKKSEHDEIEKRLQIKFEDIRELYKQITVTLNVGLDKLIQDLKKDNFTKKILQNLLNYDSDQISSIDKCDLLINIANTLHTTVVAKIKALNHINTSMKSLREVIKQRERQISELQTGNKHMQETVRKTKNELSKQNETNAIILHSKLEEIQSLQQENQNLTNELNTVKIQMELKVHSLKEKLVDCENETDELKKDYECQVENLNVIINKVTEHLKEKTSEIQLAAEEKEKMQQEVEKYKNEIKCLEEELKSNIQNLERVSNEFESEKLVLKNMVTVTESVMEDQKVSLNNTITELMNENKLLQEEKSAIKQQIENVTAEFEAIMREKETALELITKEHAELTLIKESLEEEKDTARKAIMTLECEIEKKENEIVKLKEEHDAILSILDAEIISLKSDAREKDEQLEKAKLENSALETVIRNYEDNVLKSLEKENAELKIKVDSLETEHLNKVDTLIESLQKEVENKKYLQIELNQKSETTLNMESKLKCIEEELNTIKLEKSELAKEKTISLTKINDLELNQLKNAEAIKTLNEYSMKLKDECAKLKESKSDLELYIAKVNKYNSEFQQDIAQTIATLNEEIAELQQNIEVLKKTNSELQENNVKLNKNITKSEKDLHNLNKVNMELTGELTKIKAEHEDTTNNFLKEKTAHEKQNEQMSTILSAGLTKLIQDLKEEAITNETIQHLINIENNDTSTVEKCDMLINIANMVTAETIMRKNLEKALEHENAVLAELKKMLQQKEMHILELESEIKRLQQIVNENKIELSKQNEMHSRALDNKIREMQILQQDNASLTNDLNDVKVQLEVKVHSLKEKLIDNENLTDKLKKTYECQIDNLNIMITKLTNYLKDKSVELEIARKEKDRLQQVIEDNNQAIKSLEEEVKTEKLSQEKLMNDFESERQVIKNMVAVTESVMADQKATFNNTISEKEKAIEILQEENRIISEERNELEVELRNKETALEHMQTELVDLKQVKECLEKEITSLKETLDSEISALKTEIHKKENEIRALKEENSQLEIINKNYKDSAVSLANQNSELKIKKDAIEVEFRDKVEKLTESLQEQIDNKKELNIELNEKTNSIDELENKLKDLQNKLIVFEQEKKHVTIEKDEYLSKVNEIQAGFENHKLKASEEMNKLNKDRAELLEENETLKQKIIELEEGSNKSMKLITELKEQIAKLQNKLSEEMNTMTKDKTELFEEKESLKKKNTELEEQTDKSVKLIMELKEQMAKLEKESTEEISRFTKEKTELFEEKERLVKKNTELEEGTDKSTTLITELKEQIAKLQKDSNLLTEEINKLRSENLILVAEVTKLTNINVEMNDDIEKKKAEITHLEENIKGEQDKRIKFQDDLNNEKVTLVNKCDILENYHTKAETELEERQKDIVSLQKQVQNLQAKVEMCVTESAAKDGLISKMSKEKDVQIYDINKELQEEKVLRTKYQNDLEEKIAIISVLKKNLDELNSEREALKILKRENEELIKAVGHRETFAVRSHENASTRKYSGQLAEKELRDLHIQVDNTSDITHSSIESLKTITDLEKIIHDKNRTITTLQSDITYLKTLMGESENKLLDVNKELELSKENCYQLSSQLKKIVHQKNEDIAELKKQISKMSVAENRATQIIKVSAKYQAIILKRIAEIKSNTILKELTNFGNTNTTCDSEVRRSLTAGSITMEDLENFLETTERHLKKCSEKQLALQKEKDRLTEVSRINESENINMKKFLTELSVRFQTFSSVKDLYAQKLSRVISVQRTVRREILSLEGHVTDKCMLKLERGYAAVMQDLAECTMNLERWVERSIGRTVSSEKIKQAVLKEEERSSLAPSTIQNTGLEVQLDELLNSFQKLLEEVSRAPKGEDAKDAQAVTLMEVRAEYEDKLNRMKSKMKQLYTEQIAVFKEKQKKEIAMLERELARARDTLSQSSRAYEDHIRGLTTELWSVGEKFLIQKDEAKYLRRKQQSGSLMSLQHVHSSGLVPTQEEAGRSSDTQSLRSLPVVNNGGTKREGRGLHMSDEEGEVFDNRYLQELATPRRVREPREGRDTGPPERLSELRWRNSLCPPHLKSSYPAETQFANAIDEDEIKAMGGGPAAVAGRQQRKEVGIIAYKKPGPPTPSKQAGRLSATDSELRESLRVEADPQPTRKTTTPSRIRNLFRSSKTDHSTDGTPRSRRLSNIFRKK